MKTKARYRPTGYHIRRYSFQLRKVEAEYKQAPKIIKADIGRKLNTIRGFVNVLKNIREYYNQKYGE